MAFSRRKGAGSDSSKRSRRGRGASRDPFEHLSEERAKAEEGEPWFLAEDDNAPDLNVQAGISSNLRAEDLALLQEGEGSGPPTTPREAVRRDRPPLDSSSGTDPGGVPRGPDAPATDPGQSHGSASVFSEPGPEPPGSYPDLEPPPTTSAFDGGTLGQLAHGTFEDPSGNAGVYGERSSGDTLALHAKDPDITPLYTEPIAAEPYEPAVVAEITDLETTEPGIQPERVTPEVETEPEDNELSELAAESEYVEPEPALDEVISGFDASESSLNEGEELDEVDEEVSTASEVLQPDDILTSYSEPERLGLASVVEEPRPDPDVIPIDTEPIAEKAHAEPGLDGSDYSGSMETSLFDPSGDPGDQVEGPKISGSASEIRDEEPLRSALLQSFKDVVARTPATPDDDGESESFGLEDASLPEEPERREVIPRKPPARPRRF